MDVKKEPTDSFDDALSTLASAALTRDSMPLIKKEPPPTTDLMEPPWFDVGVIRGTSCLVNCFYPTDSSLSPSLSTDNLPDYSDLSEIKLCPGAAYKFRVAAINSYGLGEWSDVSAFKTCLPGYPGGPCQIKINRLPEGARLQWEPPTLCAERILEYSVCLAVKTANNSGQIAVKDLPFRRVYCGQQNYAIVDNESLKAAHIDRTSKPAVIFRIAARNEKGYGPATQVRWLQDSASESSKKDTSKKQSKLKA